MTKINKTEIALLVFSLLFPCFFTLVYFEWFSKLGGLWMKAAYITGKTIQFALPVLIIAVIHKQPWLIRPFTKKGFLEGLLFGCAVFAVMAMLFLLWFGRTGGILGPESDAAGVIQTRMSQLGFVTPALFLSLGFFYCLIHSGAEEYYWRWYMFDYYSKKFDWRLMLLLSSLGFTFHHIVILGNFFGYGNPWAWFFSFCVGIGGAYWCWLYRRSGSIWAAWISHGVIDAAIFAIGYYVLFIGGSAELPTQ